MYISTTKYPNKCTRIPPEHSIAFPNRFCTNIHVYCRNLARDCQIQAWRCCMRVLKDMLGILKKLAGNSVDSMWLPVCLPKFRAPPGTQGKVQGPPRNSPLGSGCPPILLHWMKTKFRAITRFSPSCRPEPPDSPRYSPNPPDTPRNSSWWVWFSLFSLFRSWFGKNV